MNKDGKARINRSPNPKGPKADGGWEMRPGGMLVQKRNSDGYPNPVGTIRIKVKHGSSCHEVIINAQASFGELKRKIAEKTGVEARNQRVIFKDKARESREFLDQCGVKDGSKIVVPKDEVAREIQRVEEAQRDIAAIRGEVDRLAKQVASAEMEIRKGKKVGETVLLTLIELLMTQLIKLDAVEADGDVKLQRRMQVQRVQKYIEVLDGLKVRNGGLEKGSFYVGRAAMATQKVWDNQQEGLKNAEQVVVTTTW